MEFSSLGMRKEDFSLLAYSLLLTQSASVGSLPSPFSLSNSPLGQKRAGCAQLREEERMGRREGEGRGRLNGGRRESPSLLFADCD